MRRLKKDDKVIVLLGNSKGLTGNILKFLGDKVVVQGVNVRKKHIKPNQQSPKGTIVQVESPIHVSNVSLCVDGKAVKLRAKYDEQGKKVLYYSTNGKEEVYRTN